MLSECQDELKNGNLMAAPPNGDWSVIVKALEAGGALAARRKAYGLAQKRMESLAKPRGSLGDLETLACRLKSLAPEEPGAAVDPAIMYTVAADHGVAARGVSPYPAKVTRAMVRNFLSGGAAINALCKAAGIDLRVVDAGCAGEPFAKHEMLLDRRLGPGTADISRGPAMSAEVCQRGIEAGWDLASLARAGGYACVCLGEMGISNSTSASALYCALLNLPPEAVAGPGSGADAHMLARKREVVALALKANAEAVESGDPFAILAALGGYEITILCGVMLRCELIGLPYLVDGFICASAYALVWSALKETAACGFLAHMSAEPAFAEIMRRMGARPILDLRLRLGEGSGCALALPILRGAAAVYNEMATLGDVLKHGDE